MARGRQDVEGQKKEREGYARNEKREVLEFKKEVGEHKKGCDM